MQKRVIDRLLKSGNWMLRFDNNGISYSGFKWKPKGQWTVAPDFRRKPTCDSGGLFGQSPKAAGFCKSSKRMVLCETSSPQIVVDGNKVKVQRAKIVEINENIPSVFIESIDGAFDLRDYKHPLPSGLTSIGGDVYLRNYKHPLPSGLTSIGGYVDLCDYKHPLPSGLTSIDGYVDLRNYKHLLPQKCKVMGKINK